MFLALFCTVYGPFPYGVCDVLGHLAPVHRCVPSACSVPCAVSWATWLLFTGVYAGRVVLCVQCPRPLVSCSRVSTLGVFSCVASLSF